MVKAQIRPKIKLQITSQATSLAKAQGIFYKPGLLILLWFLSLPALSGAEIQGPRSCGSLLSSLDTILTRSEDSQPLWAREHVSPKPLTLELIRAVDKIPEFSDRRTRILVPIAAGASGLGVDALISKARHMKHGIELHMWVNGIPLPIMDKVRGAGSKVKIVAHFLGPNMRKLYQDNLIELVPGYLAQFAARVKEQDPSYQFDVVMVRVSRPTKNNELSLGATCDLTCTVLKQQPSVMVIGEVNPLVPVTFVGKTDGIKTDGPPKKLNAIPITRFAALFPSDSKLAYPEVVPTTSVEEAIGRHAASLIPNGSTIQLGIGNIFGGLPAGFRHHMRYNIRIWSEMMGDVLMEVMTDKIATEAVIGFGFGSQKFYDWLNLNPQVLMAPTADTNNTQRISKRPGFHAVNTALQVALTGEVNATTGSPDRGRISSPGGQVEFLLGASRSKNGKSIIVIRSTALVTTATGSKMISTIVPRTYPVRDGSPSAFISHIVTEYGVAFIRGKSERERAIALIRISHPDFRNALFSQAIDPTSPDRVPGLVEADRAKALKSPGEEE